MVTASRDGCSNLPADEAERLRDRHISSSVSGRQEQVWRRADRENREDDRQNRAAEIRSTAHRRRCVRSAKRLGGRLLQLLDAVDRVDAGPNKICNVVAAPEMDVGPSA
jgi:hypothetical protein